MRPLRLLVIGLLILLALPVAAGAQSTTCPCTVFGDTAPSGDALQDSPIEVGMKIRPSEDGYITALRFYKQPNNGGIHTGHLWTSDGRQLAEVRFTNETASGWQEQTLPAPIPVTKDNIYVTSYYSPNGTFGFSPGYFSADVGSGSLIAPSDTAAAGNGVYRYGSESGFPSLSWNGTNYWVDATFASSRPADGVPPVVDAVTPSAGATGVPLSTNATATFDEAMDPATITSSTFTLAGAGGAAVAASVSYDAASRTATLTPSAPLDYGVTYTATVKGGAAGVKDPDGNPLAADKTWQFSGPAACPCSVFSATEGPLGSAMADAPLEVGMKFRSAEDGWITALRFYKQPNNTGTHVGHLWTADGQKLAEVAFQNETPSGWQQAELPAPVQITKDTTYTTSYHSSNGTFAFSPGFFATGTTGAPLYGPADALAGGNGVYRYGPSGFPDSSFNGTNYWVDAAFERVRPADTRPPSVTGTTPDDGAVRVPQDTTVKVTFDEPLDPLTVNTGSMTLKDGAGVGVASTVAYDAATRTATLTPTSPLKVGESYRATVLSGNAGVTDAAGNQLPADKSWTFSTAPTCPCTIFKPTEGPAATDATHDQPVELGAKFRSAEDGYITALRFFKQANNTGIHVGNLWSASGQLLASARFTGETASGWQNVDLPNPVPVTKGTTYVTSYYSPGGFFPFDQGGLQKAKDGGVLTALADGTEGGNGVYHYGASDFPTSSWNATNYWVDATFERTVPPDTRGPSITETTPAANASDVPRDADVKIDFDEQLSPASVTATTATLKTADGAAVPATVSYDAQLRRITLHPQAPLAYQSHYVVTLAGGANGIKDAAGNPLAADKTWSFTVTGMPPSEGPGGPILLVTDPGDAFGRYYAEILRSEGLNDFSVVAGPVTSSSLSGHTTVLLAESTVSDAEQSLLTSWVQGGGNLIAMRPDKKLAGLLGLTDAAATLKEGYLKVDRGSAAGAGIEGQTMQFHGTADRYSLNGASAVATLYSSATAATSNPAVSLRDVGTAGGQAAAFAFDLARSVVYTRQGNPAWAGQKRDGTPNGIRPDDLFYGAKAGDVQPDWVDPSKFAVPQADEQQRLLANLITQMNLDKAPLPRFWYLPRGEKAAIVMTGDDHSVGGTKPYFDRLKAASKPGCSVVDWECARATSYVYTGTPITQAEATAYENEGFEIALHTTTNCQDYTPASLDQTFTTELGAFRATWPDLTPPVSNRTHCIVWSDWASQAKIERAHGIRFDTNYYYNGPPEWIQKMGPGLMTGSGFPQRFADLDGSTIDVYQSMTQVSDEADAAIPTTDQIHALLDNALGPKEYWGVFDVIIHSDFGDHDRLVQMIGEAQKRGVPLVTSAQMLEWLDARNGSSFADVSYSANKLTFGISPHADARGLQAMLPARSADGPLSKLTLGGKSVSWNHRTVKGVDYVVFDAQPGTYTATYADDTMPPDVSNVSVTPDAEGHATVSWKTDEPSTSVVSYGRTGVLGLEASNSAPVTDHTVELTGLDPGATISYRVTSEDSAGNGTTVPAIASPPSSFTVPATAIVDSRTAEFAAGTTGAGTYAGDTLVGPDGELQLKPTVGDEFEGSTLSSTWISRGWWLGGQTPMAGGALAPDGGEAYTTDWYAPPRTLEFAATFQGVKDQAVGLGGDLSDYPYAVFTTSGPPYQLSALSGAGPGAEASTPLPNISLYQPHRFRIEWGATAITYYVDGVQVASHAVTLGQEMRPVISDYGLFGADLHVHWIRMSSYPATGTFVSRALDSGLGANVWGKLTATSQRPTGTSITFETRSGGTAEPDAAWSPWVALGTGGAITSPAARYLQYRATLRTTNANATPTLQRAQVTYTAGTDKAPVQGTVSVAPGTPRTDQKVTASVSGFSDADGDPLTYSYRWYRNGIRILGATTPTLDLALAGNGDRGDAIRVEVSASDGRGASSDPASAKLTVADTAPTAGSVDVKPAPPSTNDTLRATPVGFADLDGDTLTYTYKWYRNGTAIPGATDRTLDLSQPGNGDDGDRIDVDVIASDGHGGASPAARGTQTVIGTNATPLAGTVAISPAGAKTNDVVTATPSGFHDPDGDALAYHYQWSRNGTAIAGATGSTLDLSQAGNGERADAIKVDVFATDPKGAATDTVSDSATVADTDPTAGTVSIKPTAPATNDTVSATVSGFADVDNDALSYNYQWFRNGEAIPGAAGRSLDLSKAGNGAAGDVLRVDVTALDGHGGTSPSANGTVTVAGGAGHPVASYGFEEAAGNVVVDQYGGNDGTITGATRVNNGRFGRALSFEGDGDRVNVPDDSSLHLGAAMTLEAWVKPTATTAWRTVIFKESGGGLDYGLYANNDTDVPHLHIGNSAVSGVDGTAELDPNRWTHLAGTYDGRMLRLYADGVLVGSKLTDGGDLDGNGPLSFGSNEVWGEQFKGLIDEVKIYNRVLTNEQIVTDSTVPVAPSTPEPPSSTDAAAIGQFAAPQDWPITPVHLASTSDGKIAAWDGFEAAVNSERRWNPVTGRFESIATGRNLFCAGHVTLPDGRLLVAGGHVQAYEGTADTNIFDPKATSWTRGPDMSVTRWYPTATALPDGRVFVISGDGIVHDTNPNTTTPKPFIYSSNTLPEIYDPATNTWTDVPAAGRNMPLYPFMFVLPNGKLFDAGPDTTTRTLDLSTKKWTVVGTSPIDGHSAVMYRPGKILKSGTWSDPEFPDRQATNRAAAIDMTAASPAWREVAPMHYRRSFHTLTVLPDGKVLTTGGQTKTDGIDETTGVLPAEMWDPDTDTWTVMASARRPRLYHSSAVLLPDGRVLLAGGGAFGIAKNEHSGEIYSPPYLFKGPRPTVTDAPSAVHYNQSFTVDTPDASKITSVSFVRMGSVTHNLDMEQRYMTLPVHQGTDKVTIDGPTSPNLAPPGFYLVFLLDAKGVPSPGQIVQLAGGTDTQPPTAPTSLTVANHSDGATLNWTASTDNVGVTSYRVYRSTTAGFTPSTSNRVASVPSGTTYDDLGLAAGTYYYKVRAVDKAGNVSGDSNQAIAIVTGDTQAPTTSMTAPAAGSSLSGTVAATASASDDVKVASVQFRVDGQDIGDADTTAPYSVSWDTKTVSDGRHSLTAVARDTSGNSKTSAAVAVEVHNTGLVAAYSFNEPSGSTVTDAAYHHDGTIVGGATRVTSGRFGSAVSFDGTSGRVAIPNDAALALSTGMTVEAWVKPSAGSSVRSVVMKEQPGGYTYALFANGDTNVPTGNVFLSSPLTVNGPSSLALDTWTHLAMTWDGSTLKLFVDGTEVDSRTAAGSLPSGTGQLSIGGSSGGAQFFNGLVDNVRLYDHALTPAEILADVNAPVTP